MKVLLVLLIGVCSALALVPPEAADENGLTKGKTCKYGGQLACTASCKAKHCDRGRCDENEDCICYDCRNATTSTDTGNPTINLVFVAQADGKSFFAENTWRNWSSTIQFCESMNMKAASITTSAQFSALDAVAKSAGFEWAYWTAGRDSKSLRQFTWNGLNQDVSATIFPRYRHYTEELTCLGIDPSPGPGKSYMYAEPCAVQYGALCEV